MTIDTHILHHHSFNTLDENGRNAVRRLYERYGQGKKLDLNFKDIFHQRQPLAQLVANYKNRLASINGATFSYLNEAQKLALNNELLFAFYIFSAQYELDETESRRQNLADNSRLIKRCGDLLQRLAHSDEDFENQLAVELSAYDHHLKYLGLTVVGPFLAEKALQLTEGKQKEKSKTIKAQLEGLSYSDTGTILNWMGELNERRLYWVWGDGLLASVLSILPREFPNLNQMGQVLDTVRNVGGYVSWILYYSRFGLNLGLLLKHTLKGPWMNAKEAEVPAWERFKTQWNQRKFAILNDSIWATVNLVTFFWLAGSGWLGYSGNILTLGLLLVDTALTIWSCFEESTRHNQAIKRLQNDLDDIEEKIKQATDATELQALNLEKENIEKAMAGENLNWRYQKYKMAAGLSYSLGLMAGFVVMCCILPPGVLPATALVLGVAGAAVCFALTVAYTAVSGAIDIAQTLSQRGLIKKERSQLLQKFNLSEDETEKKFLYLEIKRLDAETNFHARKAAYQSAQLIRGLFIDALVPALVFASLTFMPMGVGIGVIAAGIALAVTSRLILSRFEPKACDEPEMAFCEEEYQAFTEQPISRKNQVAGRFGIFGESGRNSDTQPLLEGSDEQETPLNGGLSSK